MDGIQPLTSMLPSNHGPVRRATARPVRPKAYRLKCEWVPVWPRDEKRDARVAAELRWARWRERLCVLCTWIGALVGAWLMAWQGSLLYGPRGAVGGGLIGAVVGSLAGFSLIALLPLLLAGGCLWAAVHWLA